MWDKLHLVLVNLVQQGDEAPGLVLLVECHSWNAVEEDSMEVAADGHVVCRSEWVLSSKNLLLRNFIPGLNWLGE